MEREKHFSEKEKKKKRIWAEKGFSSSLDMPWITDPRKRHLQNSWGENSRSHSVALAAYTGTT